MLAAVGEGDPRPCHQVPHSPRHEHLAGLGDGRHARADVDGNPRHVAVALAHLARVQAAAHVQPGPTEGVAD
ncbi:MAG TPA: hypothetical protein VGJ58_07215, partial [Gaiellaceae bacterium]